MKCELCHKAEAETAIRKQIEGETRELYVCQGCARKEHRHEAAAGAQKPAPHAAPAEGVPSGPLMSMILDAAFEIVGRAVSVKEPTCPVCGILRDEYRKRQRLGCPACYEAFSKELDAAIFDMHQSRQHVGKAPEKARSAWQRLQLEKALEEAVKGQRYEEAIDLRDQLRKLDEQERRQGEAPSC